MDKKVLIIGLGLIGSSLALCIKKEHPFTTVIGIDNQVTSEEFALKRNIIDQIGSSLETEAVQADIIFLCTPVKSMLKQLNVLGTLSLKQDVIISDVGSTKREIVQVAKKSGLKTFIGGHPMAGSHKSGVTAADENLFENAYYILASSEVEKQSQIKELQTLLQGTRAKFVVLTAEEHDQITGMLSHLPHIIAAGLVNQSKIFNDEHPRSRQLAAGGFRDITRIASSDPQMWTDILLSNKESLLTLMNAWQAEMDQVSTWIQTENKEAIFQFFYEAKETRNQMPVHKEGAIPAFHDLFVDVPDVPGVIAEITGLLGKAKLSLINLKILETREDIYGILQLTFKRQEDLEKAKDCIKKQTNYLCYEK
ncbi:prephenate dehydrogenase [Enterococcus haemoperoxidus ATCC BAA-382]|uniref:Prephenate dehydrogenase n=1 Tax=Enterococcus haemoperoxidus ATCC BAA-382 TaxID=1158608 RepID=R2T0L9_9ENTE|nr:prephenate dehydrogenase [Enterococcus haemoperoxidus]EOH98596.1 prephenate dehydrogenase [Enterococcus haemoperoxidus ATCC BAA-382]EOT62221.1 prephenate dehydrogenase [Enterococcus haemoperoxidus ATCC BAA-382]OJG55697.1 prephenate dehydrogenase [Enterococcus haemoperoxidus]